MPDLNHSLLKQDLGHLRIIAELWGIELESKDVDPAREELSASLLDADLLAELMDSLSPLADSAITELVNAGGRIAWATFARKYGDIREMGAGRRDRERPHLKPSSTAEILFYRGLLARAFFESDKGSQEFAYIPDDLLLLMESVGASQSAPEGYDSPLQNTETIGRPASPGEKGNEFPANNNILDEATTLLAALRMGRADFPTEAKLKALLESAKLIKKDTIQTDAVKSFLEAPRADALKMLHDAWLESAAFNELKLMPGIVCEGEWTNQPLETREFLLNLLEAIPEGKWWSLNAFVRDIKQKYADFQRPAGDYDSWFIKRESDGQFLRGFAYWDHVDGALIKFFITGILYWLGQVDLSVAEGATEPTAFRITSFESAFDEKEKISVSSNGKIIMERKAPRVVRYQVARFCEWDESVGRVVARFPPRIETKRDEFKYQITAQSLKHAREQGLKAEQLLSLLVRHTDGKVPPPLVQALKRWEVNGTEARVETQVVLRVTKPEVLEEMRKSRAGKFLGEILSPTTVIVKSGAIQQVMDALAEIGLFAEIVKD
ncbi:MAG TPA: helicase-associated domain-containing protein [Anaerolineales bacterium]|nr:helicase-associated domain-containing protein [Anaerolineales bacterium]